MAMYPGFQGLQLRVAEYAAVTKLCISSIPETIKLNPLDCVRLSLATELN